MSLSEPGSTELTGLFLEKPPSNVVALAGEETTNVCRNPSNQTACGLTVTSLFVNGRIGYHFHSQGGLHHPDEETHHEVAEGEMDGPRQQGRETHAVQRDVRQKHKGVCVKQRRCRN